MVAMTPKALRFVRLAAERMIPFRNDPQLEMIRREEAAFRHRPVEERVRQHIEVSDETAAFCAEAVEGFLSHPEIFTTGDWDGNDFAFMEALQATLRHQVSLLTARSF